MYCVDDIVSTHGADLLEIALDGLGMKEWVKIRDGYIHCTYQTNEVDNKKGINGETFCLHRTV